MVNPALIHLLDINPVEIQNNISKDNLNINEVGIAQNMMHNLEENNIKIFLSLALFDEKEEIIVKSDYNFIYKVDNLEENYKINDEGETVFNATLVKTLLGMSYSTLRGIIFNEFITVDKIIIPIIDPQLILENRIKIT